MKDKQGSIIYVGKAKNLKKRVNSYFVKSDKNLKTQLLVNKIVDFDYIITTSEFDALMLENNLIKKHMPYYNILLKDDKNFPYIKIDLKQQYPKFEITRKVKRDNAKYFGPYFAGVSYKQILEIIQIAFLVRNCNKKFSENNPLKRPCLNYSLGICTAPCINNVSKVEYRNQIDNAIMFLNGNTKMVEQILNEKMVYASNNLNFERAIQIREQLKTLKRIKQHYTTQFPNCTDLDCINYYDNGINISVCVLNIRSGKMVGCDNFYLINSQSYNDTISQFILQYYGGNKVIPKEIVVPTSFEDEKLIVDWLNNTAKKIVNLKYYKKGIKLKLLNIAKENAKEFLEKSLGKEKIKEQRTLGACERLQTLLKLKYVPKRMECYDISNISGTNKVASMVVFVNGEPAKKMYRKFIIKTVVGQDDFACLKEAIKRRVQELETGKDISFSSKPNLIVIDGGKGQLSAVFDEIKNMSSIDFDLISLAKQNEEIFLLNLENPILLKKTDIALQLLQRIRDEAHRFAITFHRQRRAKNMIKSELDSVKGVGKVKKTELFNHFESIENIKNATIEELSKVKGIDYNLAKKIFETLNSK